MNDPRQIRCVLVFLLMWLTGCVTSLNPLYDATDVLIDPTPYAGVWKNDRWSFRIQIRDYALSKPFPVLVLEIPDIHTRPPDGPSPRKGAVFSGGIVKIGEQLFLDLTADRDLNVRQMSELAPTALLHMVSVHTFFKLKVENERLTLQALDQKKIVALLAREPNAVNHAEVLGRDDGGKQKTGFILTAKPAELRAFLQKFADRDIWMEPKTTIFTRGDEKEFERQKAEFTHRLEAAEKAWNAAAPSRNTTTRPANHGRLK